jgi:hypothetical protein
MGAELASVFAAMALTLAVQTSPPHVTLSADETRRVQTFAAEVGKYTELHRRLEGPVATLESSDDPAKIRAAVSGLAQRIRNARRKARPGDVFTPLAAPVIRRIVLDCGCREAIDDLLALYREEEQTTRAFVPRVNGSYPDDRSLMIMPPALLCSLPELPPELQYRLVGRDLILWDSHANLIVDVLSDVLPRSRERGATE